jgi:hypothetical protein
VARVVLHFQGKNSPTTSRRPCHRFQIGDRPVIQPVPQRDSIDIIRAVDEVEGHQDRALATGVIADASQTEKSNDQANQDSSHD